MDFVHGESVSKMDWITIGEVTYTEDGVYVNGKLVFANDAWYIEPPDYVDVTRCCDCEFSKTDDDNVWCDYFLDMVEPNGFCKWAKKKQ